MEIQIKQIDEEVVAGDGYRVLVDGFVPRGVSEADSKVDEWAKQLAPSDELRKWFDQDPEHWEAFRHRYALELEDNVAEVKTMLERCGQKKLTLLYAAKDTRQNSAAVLMDFIQGHLERHPRF